MTVLFDEPNFRFSEIYFRESKIYLEHSCEKERERRNTKSSMFFFGNIPPNDCNIVSIKNCFNYWRLVDGILLLEIPAADERGLKSQDVYEPSKSF